MDSRLVAIDTAGGTVIDLTAELVRFCADRGDGLVNAFAPHATAGLALMEVGSGSEGDLEQALGRILPRDDRYRHRHGATGHGADHLLPALVSPSLTVPVLGGGHSWVPGRVWSWSTPIPTTATVRSDSASWPGRRVAAPTRTAGTESPSRMRCLAGRAAGRGSAPMPLIRINPKVSVSVVFVAAMFMNIMDITIVNVALPSIGREFGVSETALDSVAVGYLVSLAVFIPAAGWLGDRFGSKRVLLFAIAVFTGASVLCGLADSLSQLVFCRVLQGVGGGMLTPVGMAMLFRTFPPNERVRASSILTVPTAMAPAIGPVLGGLLVTNLSWRWVFFVNLPIGIVAFAFGLIFLEEHRQPHPGRFDAPRVRAVRVRVRPGDVRGQRGPDRGWGSPEIVGSHRPRRRPAGLDGRAWSSEPASPCSSCASTATGCSGRPAWCS